MVFLPDGRPARFDWSVKTTYDPTEEGMEFPYPTVFYGPCNGDEIVWSEIEMFSRAEEGKGFEVMEFEKVEDVVITIMERAPQEVSRYIHQRKERKKVKRSHKKKLRAVQEIRKIRWHKRSWKQDCQLLEKMNLRKR